MLTFDSALTSTLAAQPNKLAWSNALKTALTATRVLRCKNDAASTVDPWTNGTEFLSVGMTGDITTTSGNITGFGSATGTTIRLAANLAIGVSVLRIEGGGHFVQGTLGLAGSTADFILPANPTMTNGIGFSSGSSVKAPRLLASGTGPAAPLPASNTPTSITLEDWTNPASPVVVGSLSFNNRVDDMVFEDVEMAAEIGDVAIYQSTQTIVFGRFEFGAQLFIAANYNLDSGTGPLEQMLIACKPHGEWPSYPSLDTYIKASFDGAGNCTNAATASSTYPSPFKIRLKNAIGDVIFTHEMQDGLPINSPLCAQSWQPTTELRPNFNCGMMLPWENKRTKKSANAGKYFPGVTPESYRNSTGKNGATVNGPCTITYKTNYQANGIRHLYAMLKWPQKADSGGALTAETSAQIGDIDPYLFDVNYHNYEGKAHHMSGWGYEPGSITGHDWYTGPGGPRFDRSVVPSVYAIWAGDQNFTRLQGPVPIREMIDGWNKAYFNHSNHWVRDVKTFDSVPHAESLAGNWVFAGAHYGSGPYGQPGQSQGIERTIHLYGMGNGGSFSLNNHADASGRMPWGGWARDSLHAYCNAGWAAVLLNSPMHVVACKHDFDTQWMSSLLEASPNSDVGQYFSKRLQAWRWLPRAMAWKTASSSSLTYSRKQIEDHFAIELENLYRSVYVPTYVDNRQDPYYKGIRQLGTPGVINEYTANYIQSVGGHLGLYTAHVMVLMKQIGMWSIMRARNDMCKKVLDMMIDMFDKFNIDWVLDTKNTSDDGYPTLSNTYPVGHLYDGSEVPNDWVGIQALIDAGGTPAKKDWITNQDGSYSQPIEQYVAQHLRYQYVCARRDYFPEYPNARLTAAIAKYKNYYDIIKARTDAEPVLGLKREKDWYYRYPALGEFNPPTSVGPN